MMPQWHSHVPRVPRPWRRPDDPTTCTNHPFHLCPFDASVAPRKWRQPCSEARENVMGLRFVATIARRTPASSLSPTSEPSGARMAQHQRVNIVSEDSGGKGLTTITQGRAAVVRFLTGEFARCDCSCPTLVRPPPKALSDPHHGGPWSRT